MTTTTMSADDLDRLEDLLASDNFHGEAMTLDAMQGFLCAVISSPDMVSPGEWIVEAIGEPTYASDDEREEVMALLMKFYNSIAGALSNDQDFDLILYGREDDPDLLDYATWCDGYVYGSQIGENDWFEAAGEYAEDLSEKMEVFFLLNGVLKEEAIKHDEPWLSPKEEAKVMAEAEEVFPGVIGDIYRFMQTLKAPSEPIRRGAPKVGRNDLCPCGSGKKFKQCCGMDHTLH
jgi:uncharacterized protein